MRIESICGPVEDVTITGSGNFLVIEIEGDAKRAVSILKNFFGKYFGGAEYDEELGYTYVGLDLAK